MSTAVDSSLSSELLDYAKALHTDEQKGDHGLHLFHHSSPSKSAPKESFYDFLTRINAGVILPEKLDTSHPLSHYYVSSSHNTYLWGNQLYGHASTTPYTHVRSRVSRLTKNAIHTDRLTGTRAWVPMR